MTEWTTLIRPHLGRERAVAGQGDSVSVGSVVVCFWRCSQSLLSESLPRLRFWTDRTGDPVTGSAKRFATVGRLLGSSLSPLSLHHLRARFEPGRKLAADLDLCVEAAGGLRSPIIRVRFGSRLCVFFGAVAGAASHLGRCGGSVRPRRGNFEVTRFPIRTHVRRAFSEVHGRRPSKGAARARESIAPPTTRRV